MENSCTHKSEKEPAKSKRSPPEQLLAFNPSMLIPKPRANDFTGKSVWYKKVSKVSCTNLKRTVSLVRDRASARGESFPVWQLAQMFHVTRVHLSNLIEQGELVV